MKNKAISSLLYLIYKIFSKVGLVNSWARTEQLSLLADKPSGRSLTGYFCVLSSLKMYKIYT